MDSESRNLVRRNPGWFIVLGIVFIILGIAAIGLPFIFTLAITLILGWVLLISGVAWIVHAFQSRHARRLWVNLIVGIIYAIAGITLLVQPLQGAITITLVLGILLVVQGILEIIATFQGRLEGSPKGLMLADGIVTLILGILIWNQWPFNVAWVLGLLFGINLLFSGVRMLATASTVRGAIR